VFLFLTTAGGGPYTVERLWHRRKA
jgi:hypothetical protein